MIDSEIFDIFINCLHDFHAIFLKALELGSIPIFLQQRPEHDFVKCNMCLHV